MLHFLSKFLSFSIERVSINYLFLRNLTSLLLSATLLYVTDKLDKTIADAQAFIDSVKAFQGGGHEHERGSDSSGSNTSSGTDSSLQSNLDEGLGPRTIPSDLLTDAADSDNSGYLVLPLGNNKDSLQAGSRPPVGKFATPSSLSFPNVKYTQPFRIELLTFVEVYYYENKKLPEVHVLHEYFKDHKERPLFLKGWPKVLDEISDSLLNRGIKPYNTVDNYVDPKFAWATSLIVNHLDKRTIPAKLKEAGLSTKEWQAFLRRKRHYDYFQSRLDEVFDNDVKNDAKIALSRSIQNGDLQAIKYYNELKNIYRPETQNAMQMVSIVLTAVMEILAIHIPPDTLNRVAAEIRTSPTVRKIIEAQAS